MRTTPYRLDELERLCAELGLACRRIDAARLDVIVHTDCHLAFCNLPDGDTLVGFEGTPWHAHGSMHFGTGDANFVVCDELEILVGLSVGDLIVVSQYVSGALRDRWITHKLDEVDFKYIRPGEELRFYRLAPAAGPV
jgi:hypothetical protein